MCMWGSVVQSCSFVSNAVCLLSAAFAPACSDGASDERTQAGAAETGSVEGGSK